MNKILVISMGGIGNLVLMLPGLKALRSHYANARIVLLTAQRGVESILDCEDLIDETICCKDRLVFDIAKKLKRYQFDVAIASSGTNAWKTRVLTWLAGIPKSIGENVSGGGFLYTESCGYHDNMHETQGMNNILQLLNIDVGEEIPLLTIQDEEKSDAQRIFRENGYNESKSLVGFHMGCSPTQLYKRWDIENFITLTKELINRGCAIVLLGGTDEKPLALELLNCGLDGVVDLTGQTSLRQTAAVIQSCCHFVSNDSGVAHIAAAVQTPLSVLFGRTNQERIKPLGDHVNLIHKGDDVNLISVEDVLSSIKLH